MKWNFKTHIIGKVYDLTQDNMNAMIAEIERLQQCNDADVIRQRLIKMKIERSELDDKLTKANEVLSAAQDLYDNRLGHRKYNPQWHTQQAFWKALGRALKDLNES